MKKTLAFLVIAVACIGFVAVAQAEDGSWTGYLSDAACAKDYEKASADHAACSKELCQQRRKLGDRDEGRFPRSRDRR